MNRRHGQHTAIMVRNSHPYHPECTSAAWTPATFLRHPATGHGAGRRTGSTPTARHVGPRSTTPGQPAPSFAGTSRRQDPATLKARPGGAPGWDWPSYMQGRCPTDPLCAGRHRYHRRKPTAIGNVARPERRLPSFGPSGHVGADAHSTPRPTAWAARRCVSDGAWTARGPSLRLLDPEASQDQRQGHSLRSRPYASLRADPCP